MRRPACALLVAFSVLPLGAECPKPGGGETDAPIVSNPNRPTVSNPADVTQYGVLEVEYGWARAWPGAGNRSDLFEGLFRFGLLCDLELRWTTDTFIGMTDSGRRQRGLGDNWTGFQYRFHRQSPRLPSMAFTYALKEATASPEKGLGSGRPDHFLGYLASKDIHEFHGDFNVNYLLAGRARAPGHDRNAQFALAVSHALKGPFGITGELYGNTRLNDDHPAFGSTLCVVNYNVNPRLTLDVAIDVGLTSGAPRKRLLAGVTYALGQIYRGLKEHPGFIE